MPGVLASLKRETTDYGKNKSTRDYFSGKLKSLGYPYAVFSVLTILHSMYSGGWQAAKTNFCETVLLIGSGTLWFLPAMFIAYMFFYCMHQEWKIKQIQAMDGNWRDEKLFKIALFLLIVVLSSIFSGAFEAETDGKISWWSMCNMINRGIIGYIWMECGFYLNLLWQGIVFRKKRHCLLVYMLILGMGTLSARSNFSVDLHFSMIGNPILYYLSGLCLSYVVIVICRIIPRQLQNFFAFLGKNSLFIFATHLNLGIVSGIQKAVVLEQLWLTWGVQFASVMFIEVVLVVFVNRYAGFLISWEKFKLMIYSSARDCFTR